MARSTLFCLALVTALVIHTSPVCGRLKDFLQMLYERYELQNDAKVEAELEKCEQVLKKHHGKTVEDVLQFDDCREAILVAFQVFLRAVAEKESDRNRRAFFLEILAFANNGKLEAVLKDSSQWPVLDEYLKTEGKSKPPSGFVSGTLQTAAVTSGILIACFSTALVLTH